MSKEDDGRNADEQGEETKVAVVTGAAGGVGSRVVALLAARGWKVTAVVRPGTDRTRVPDDGGVTVSELDLRDADSVNAWGRGFCESAPRVSLLVNAAAVAIVGPASDLTPQDWHEVMETNLIAPAVLTSSLLPSLRRAQGTVVFINSGAGERAVENHAAYVASKHALRGYANTLRIEESRFAIRVTTIYPGQIATSMLQGIDDRLGVEFDPQSYIDPATVARAVVWVGDASPDVHISNIDLRPRREVSARFTVS